MSQGAENIIKHAITLKINEAVDFAVSDNRTFLKAKAHNLAVGGGNFSITLYSFAVINFLAKIYNILKGGEIIRKDDVSKLNKFKTELKENNKEFFNKYKSEINKLFLIEGNVKETESECFKNLCLATKGINWGVSNGKEGKVWREYRNSLSHLSYPSRPASAISPDIIYLLGYDNYLECLNCSVKPIIKNSVLDADLLNARLILVKEFILEEVSICKNATVIDNLSAFLKLQ